MKKILFLFALTMLFAFGASAQSFPTTVQVDPTFTSSYVEAVDVYDTTIGTTTIYEFDFDSIISIDSIFDPHGICICVDTTYLCIDSMEITDTIAVLIPDFHNYCAVADSGWRFDHWLAIVPTYDATGIIMDTAISHTIFFGDDLDDDFWGDWPGIPDSTDSSMGAPITIIAYFTSDTNNVGIREVNDGTTFMVYPNPTSGTLTIIGDIHWITVFDISGRAIVSTNKPVIDLHAFPNGTYFVQVDTGEQVSISKVIKR